MYTEFFRLSSRPFGNEPGADFHVANEAVATATERLQSLMLARDAIAIVSGGPGVGKTSLVQHAASSIGDRTTIAWLDMRQVEPEVLYDMLLLGLGAETSGGNTAVAVHRLREAINRENRNGRRVTAVIDVNGLNTERARWLLRLVHMAGHAGGQLNIVLQGPHTLQKAFDLKGLIQVRQKVGCKIQARPLTAGETAGYLRHQLQMAGAGPGTIMDDDVPQTVHGFVAGVPRLINTMMDAVLCEAALSGKDRISAAIVTNIARQLGWRALRQPERSRPPATAARPQAPKKPDTPPKAPFAKEASPGETWLQPGQMPGGDGVDPMKTLSEMTSRLLSTARLPGKRSPDKQKKPEKAAEEKPPAMPEMNPKDTGATGMLKLEDLDERFAETIFSDDSGVFEAVGRKDGDGSDKS